MTTKKTLRRRCFQDLELICLDHNWLNNEWQQIATHHSSDIGNSQSPTSYPGLRGREGPSLASPAAPSVWKFCRETVFLSFPCCPFFFSFFPPPSLPPRDLGEDVSVVFCGGGCLAHNQTTLHPTYVAMRTNKQQKQTVGGSIVRVNNMCKMNAFLRVAHV